MIISLNHRSVLVLFFLFCALPSWSSNGEKKKKEALASPVLRADPPFWWTGMKEPSLELLLYGPQLRNYPSITLRSAGTTIQSVTPLPNRDYVIVKLLITAEASPGFLEFSLSGGSAKPATFRYALKAREDAPGAAGISPSDLIYLIFPDRFANGNPVNDVTADTYAAEFDRTKLKHRHGGDLKGISDRLGYIEDIGTTALWLNPVLENNMDKESYHGYAATDHYRIDPRFGSNEEFKKLVSDCHSRGIKVVWDVVYNHWGNLHYLHKNLPDSNWVHWFPEFTRTSYRAETLLDPYASEADRMRMTDAWFDQHMPDLNQQDPHLAAYLIQQSVWWVEYARLDAFRIDTYAYPDQVFMRELNQRMRLEYPNFVLFGETWVQGSPVQAWFTEKNGLNKSFSSELQGVTDFQLYYSITKGLIEPFGWDEGLRRIQLTLSHDILYHDPFLNVTFLDNHDLGRYFSTVNEDMDKWKMGIAMLLTLRGIPQIYYGTEILMTGYTNPDALVRQDFPGGWPADTTNKFNPEGRTAKENEAFNFYRNLANWRKNNPWIGRAELTQFVPEDNTYVYFRSDDGHTLMCAYNLNDKPHTLLLSRFAEKLQGKKKGKDILTGVPVELGKMLEIPAKSAQVIVLE
ncbi:MAG: glycoside hydrolase family 13 protein [Flavobacteriales bacterium]